VTITKAITIDGGGGQVASVLVSGTNGIVVSAGQGDVVILRNLRINGIGTGINGIRFLAGAALIVDKCEIFGFTTNGVDISLSSSASVWVTGTNIENIGGTGVAATTSAGVVTVGIDQVRVERSNKGMESGNHSRLTVNNSFVQNAASIGMQADGDAVITVNNSEVDLSGSGVQTGPGSGTAFVSNSQVAFNTTGFNQTAGTINTYGNNRLQTEHSTPRLHSTKIDLVFRSDNKERGAVSEAAPLGCYCYSSVVGRNTRKVLPPFDQTRTRASWPGAMFPSSRFTSAEDSTL
jgi:hypothetical protein